MSGSKNPVEPDAQFFHPTVDGAEPDIVLARSYALSDNLDARSLPIVIAQLAPQRGSALSKADAQAPAIPLV